jgi:small basic protein
MENVMSRVSWNDLVVALTLVHLGQQLGTQSALARAVFDIATIVASFFGRIT